MNNKRLILIVLSLFCMSAYPVADGAIVLRDVTKETGITFVHTDGSTGEFYIMETVSAGLALFDYDGDSDIDIYFLNGAPLKGAKVANPPTNKLYRNDGNFKFTDVTKRSGAGDTGFALGVAVGDYDNDGDLDMYVNNYGPNVMYRNNGDGTFTDVTSQAGVAGGEKVGATAHFLDMDKDGDLDLFVANYVDFTYETHQVGSISGVSRYAGPLDYPPTRNNLYRNNGDGTFTDVSVESGIAEHKGWGMGGICVDYDNDGDTDIRILNDVYADFLFQNDGTGKFKEIGLTAGLAYNIHGDQLGSMGVDCMDYDNDGWLDFFQTSYSGSMAVLYRNLEGFMFEDVSITSGAGGATFAPVTWGTGFVDFDNDGDRDIFVACGHLEDTVELYNNSETYFQENILLMNTGNGKFKDVSKISGDGMKVKLSSRGAGFDDLDGDGDIDVVILNSRREPTILRNDSENDNHWIQIRLRGVKTNRDGVGARVKVVSGDLVQIDEVHSGRGYQSHYGMQLHFGLGDKKKVDRIEVRWIGGGVDVVENVAVDQRLIISESESKPEPVAVDINEQIGFFKRRKLELAEKLHAQFPDQIEPVILLGNVHRDRGDNSEAIRYWEQALRLGSPRADLYEGMGMIAMEKGQYAEAVGFWRKALDLNLLAPGLRNSIAQALMRLNKFDEAMGELQQQIRLHPSSQTAHFLAGQVFLQKKEYESARKEYLKVLELTSEHTNSYYGLLTVSARLGEKDKVREYTEQFNRCKARDTQGLIDGNKRSSDLAGARYGYADTAFNAGRLYEKFERMQEATVLLDKAVEASKGNSGLTVRIAQWHFKRGRLTKSLSLHEQIAKANPENALNSYLLGVLYAQARRFDDARESFMRSIEYSPESPDAYRELARLSLQMRKDIAQAKILAEKAVSLAPAAVNYFVLSRACDTNGDRQGALSALEKAVELDPDNAEYRRIYGIIVGRKQ